MVSQVNLLLDRGADINAQNKRLWTPLHCAAEKGEYDVVQRLVDAGADASLEDIQKRTAWRVALLNKRDRCAIILRGVWAEVLGAEADLVAEAEATQDDKDAVFKHAVGNRADGVEAILGRGLPVDFADINGTTILMAAAAAGSRDVVNLCIRKGANIRRANVRGRGAASSWPVELSRVAHLGCAVLSLQKEGRTALHVCCEHEDIATLLLSQGCEAGALDGKDRSALHEAALHGWVMTQAVEAEGLDVNMADEAGLTPLMEAARNAHAATCTQLINLGARVNTVDRKAQTALHYAAVHSKGNETLDALLMRGASVNAADSHGRTALHKASALGYVDNCTSLLEAGANVAVKDEQQHTAARTAVDHDQNVCLTLIMQYGGSATDADDLSHTPLFRALKRQNAAAVATLIKHGGDVMEEYRDGSTPLHVAAASGCDEGVETILAATEMVQFLVEKTNRRGDIAFMAGCRTGKGGGLEQLKAAGSAVPFNCLHAAAAAPKKRALEFMLAHGGVDVNHRDTAVRTCLAGDCCRVECVALTACMLPRATHHCTTLQ